MSNARTYGMLVMLWFGAFVVSEVMHLTLAHAGGFADKLSEVDQLRVANIRLMQELGKVKEELAKCERTGMDREAGLQSQDIAKRYGIDERTSIGPDGTLVRKPAGEKKH